MWGRSAGLASNPDGCGHRATQRLPLGRVAGVTSISGRSFGWLEGVSGRFALGVALVLSVVVGTFTTAVGGVSSFESDDFNAAVLDGRWSVVDPVGDGSVVVSGAGSGDARLGLAVPGGVNHNGSSGDSLRVMQGAVDEDFEIEVKFDSVPVAKYQQQGVLVAQDDDDWLLFSVHHNGKTVKSYTASVMGGVVSTVSSSKATVGSSAYLRVSRVGDLWTYSVSADGVAWQEEASFSRGLAVGSVGPFAANYLSNGNAPQFTALVDYFFNTDSPVVPEDPSGAQVTLSTGVVGQGTVTRSPDEPTYDVGSSVEMTAVSDPGWSFSGWSGDLVGSTNPATVVLGGDSTVTATFVQDSTPPVVSAVAVTGITSSGATVSWTTDEPATSSVAVGTTTAYELGTFGSSGLTTGHSVVVSGLAASTLHHFEISSTDQAGNTATEPDGTFTTAVGSGPMIDVWEGPTQVFGVPGIAQRWVNILGNASDPDGVATMSYSLNGGPSVPMGIGPDGRRLVNAGDFNVDVLVSSLLVGANVVDVTATDGVGETTQVSVVVDHQTGSTWPLPYAPNMGAASKPSDIGQVVDGKWEVNGGLLSTGDADIGYDRLVSIGDPGWTDIEATFTMRVNSLANPPGPVSGQPMAGFLLRWNGHNAKGGGHQPQIGYLPNGSSEPTPFGALGVWRNGDDGGRLEIRDHRAVVQATDGSFDLTLGETYRVRARVVDDPVTGSSTYSFRVWPDGAVEPSTWDLEYTAGTLDYEPGSGSLVLLAHEADVDFGEIAVQPASASSEGSVLGAASGETDALVLVPLQLATFGLLWRWSRLRSGRRPLPAAGSPRRARSSLGETRRRPFISASTS